MTTGERTRALRDWAFFTSLVVITGLAGIFLPPAYFLASVVLPVPVILLLVRLDIRYGILSLAVAGLIFIFFVPHPAAALVLIMHYGLLGILYGLLFKNHVSPGRSIAAGLLGAAVLALLSAGLIYALTGANPFVLSPEARQAAEKWMAANQQAGTFHKLPSGWQENFGKSIIAVFELLIPGQFIVTAATASAITYFLARAVLRRLDFPLPPGPVFTRMSFPWYSIWGLIAGLGLTLAGDQFSFPTAAKAGKNILFVLFYAYLALGLSVAAYFYQNIKLAGPIKIFLLFLAVIYFPFSTVMILLLGVTDPLVNFRRLPSGKHTG